MVQRIPNYQSLGVGSATPSKGHTVWEQVLMHYGDLLAVAVVVPYSLSYGTWGLIHLRWRRVGPGAPNLRPKLPRYSPLPVPAFVEHLLQRFL